MSDESTKLGHIGWTDLTVPDAASLKDFYRDVVGWKVEPTSLGDYDDFTMKSPVTDLPVAGICHAKGGNSMLPPVWLIYVAVEDVDASAKTCVDLGGEIIKEPFSMGAYGRFCVIKDPTGATLAIYTPGQ